MSSYEDRQFEDLINKEIVSIQYTESNLEFKLKDASIIKFYAEGDCCSQSFIEDLDNPEIFQDAVFLSVESVEGDRKDIDPDKDGYSHEVHKWTFYKFKTNKGMCTLSFRNESNGYYNGHLERIEND